MEAKVFFSKSSNILSVAILLAGLTTFGAGIYISETNAKDMRKQLYNKEQQVERLEDSISRERGSTELYKTKMEEQGNEVNNLLKQNDDLKKKVITYKNRSESPTPVIPSRGESANRKVMMEVTGYTAGYESTQKKPSDSGYGRTASGTYVSEGRTIACPRSMKFGTKVNIQGVGLRVCEDRGGAITEGHMDVYFNSLGVAQNFGRKTVYVEILN